MCTHLLCFCYPCYLEGHEGVKWELGFALFRAGKMGFTAVGLGFNY